MIKTYCDYCEREIDDSNKVGEIDHLHRLSTTLEKGALKLKIQVVTGSNTSWNSGDFCKYCVLDALYTLDDRPKVG